MPRRPVKRPNKRNLKRKTSRFPKKRVKKKVNTGNLRVRNLQPYIETKSLETGAVSLFMDTTSATLTKPQATTVIVPPAWANGLVRGLGSSDVIGQDVYDRYLNMKMLIDFTHLVPATLPPTPITNIRFVQGWVKRQMSSSVLVANYLSSDFTAICQKAMLDNDFGSNFLNYSQKWKDIKIIKSGYLRPKNANKNFNPPDIASSETIGSHPEAMRLKFNWTIQRKSRLTPATGGTVHFRADSWIPFVCFYSSTLHGQNPDQVPQITHVSKLWFTDS